MSIENLSDDEIVSLEAQMKEFDFGPSGIHPDRRSIENFSADELRGLEAMVTKRRNEDIPYREYFNNLVNNPDITNAKQFENATIRSMQSNEIMREFVSSLIYKINDKTTQLKFIAQNDKIDVESIKLEIEKLVIVYEKYLYKLKENKWNFETIGFDIYSMRIPEELSHDLWDLQKKFDFTFSMLVPVDLGDDYGHQFERECKLIPGLTLMYDDLVGKAVNWHQVLIYKENELTPYQRFLQNQKLRAFENARRMEISDTLSKLQNNSNTIPRGKGI